MSEAASVILKPSLSAQFGSAWSRCRILFFSAPCGCGKTAAAGELLRGKAVWSLGAAGADFAAVPKDVDAVLVDELQLLQEPERQQALCELIRRRPQLHFVLLGRGRLPGWLMPFQLAGILQSFGTEELLLDTAGARALLVSGGFEPSPAEMVEIQREFKGYPLALHFLCARMAQGAAFGPALFDDCRRAVFIYFDEAVFRRFDAPVRQLLLSLAPFESFCLELARLVSGDPRAGEWLGLLLREASMLLYDGLETYRFWPVFREFLLWEQRQIFTDAEQRQLFSRAALYYELNNNWDEALRCYSLAGEQSRISALLVKNAEQHPGIGHYRELQEYYFALPREQILRSPALMCGMSLLCSMCLDYEASEEWYGELRRYAGRLSKTDAEYRDAQGRIAFLDISLPQRGSRGLVQILGDVFRVMSDRQLNLPALSVTSTLPSIMNGGKDFCDWSKKDELLYATMRRPVESVLGRDGVGLADCAICESKFEQGEDVSRRLLTLMSRLGEIQARGTPDIEFAVVGLLARVQLSQGKARAALESLESLRAKFVSEGQTRFLGNLDALCCRIYLRLGDTEAVRRWLEQAPKNGARLWTMWRYQYLTRAMAEFADGGCQDALLLLARLQPYFDRCARVMDGIHLRLLMALCHERLGAEEWRSEFCAALDTCLEYRFVTPAAQYGAAILPLLSACGWEKDPAFLARLTAAARQQAVYYPRFLRRPSPPAEPLSPAEQQVLKLLCDNLSNQEIGEILNIKLPTVKTHVSHILQKLGVSRRSEVREAAERLQLLE